MEFLPSDIAPLHDPTTSPCAPDICLDPRRSAEEACSAALAKSIDLTPIARLSMDIERALNDPDVYELPRIAQRASQARALTDKPMARIHADTLLATAPLFELRQNHETSDTQMHESYLALAGLASQFSFDGTPSTLRRGIEAEIAIHAALLRGGRNVPYLTSPREEASQKARLNNDLGLYSPATGYTEKVPVQIKRTVAERAKYIENRVLPLVAEKACKQAVMPIIDISKIGHRNYVDLVYALVKQEGSEGLFSEHSREGKALDSLATALNDEIDIHREQFKEAVKGVDPGHSVRALIDYAFGDRPGVMLKAEFRESRYVQLSSGAYIFFNRLTAVRREHESDPRKSQYRLTFGINNLTLGIIEYAAGVHETTFTNNQKYPDTTAAELLSSLAEDTTIPWSPC